MHKDCCSIKSSRDVVDLNADFLIRTVIIKVLGRAGSLLFIIMSTIERLKYWCIFTGV
jgi:hypothetical protein